MVKALAVLSGRTGRRARLARERANLAQSWASRPSDLDEYLVTGYQNPRINAQSILTRHLLVRKLFGSEFDPLMREELAFCVEATEVLRQRAAELGVKMGTYLNPTKRAVVAEVCKAIALWEDTYECRWAESLTDRKAGSVRVLELGCGSANDYRYFQSYGLARFLDYTGVDLSSATIDNAHTRFPHIRFEVQDILDLPYDDQSYDYVIAFDILEHLSPEALAQAIDEASRLAKRGVILTFFSMADIPEHEIRPEGTYYRNVLSAPVVRERLAKDFADVRATHIRALFRDQFRYRHAYNSKAWTVAADRS